jgi:type I restriction enzyme R subunit
MDECHRSIYGTWQAALAHFDAFHIGLTATPAIYIERNTFQFYHCKDNTPDYSYPIQEALKEGFLAPYKFASGITSLVSEGANVDEEHYDPAEFERKWTNEASNRLMMEEFDRLAWESYKELAPGQKKGPGKSVVFAISKHHAARLTHYLNELHPEHKGHYAEVITSDVANADDLIRRFKQEELPMVAVSVGMLDTGFDCREILHLVMCRRVRSPILYQQMRGRGTRTAPRIGKEKFVIYDFFGNHEYFNDSDTDIFAGTGGGGYATKPKQPGGNTARELIELGLEDEWLDAVHYIEIGPDGERVDKRDYVTDWEQTVRQEADGDPIIAKVKAGEALSEQEENDLAHRLNQPQRYFNEDNLRRAYRNPGGNLVDFIRHALGVLKIKSREERVEDNFRAWLVAKNLTPEQAQYIALLKNRGLVKGKVSLNDLFSPPLSILNAANIGIELFGEQGLRAVMDEINQSVLVA